MPTSRPELSDDVFVAPSKPAKAPPPRVRRPAGLPACHPITSALILGGRPRRSPTGLSWTVDDS
jgi:hypothetical protein